MQKCWSAESLYAIYAYCQRFNTLPIQHFLSADKPRFPLVFSDAKVLKCKNTLCHINVSALQQHFNTSPFQHFVCADKWRLLLVFFIYLFSGKLNGVVKNTSNLMMQQWKCRSTDPFMPHVCNLTTSNDSTFQQMECVDMCRIVSAFFSALEVQQTPCDIYSLKEMLTPCSMN